jgi:regulator of nonsense transcripts 1
MCCRYGLDICLYDKLLDGGLESLLLEVQYRMHPKIAEFPSKQFYDGQIVSGITISDRALVKVRAAPTCTRLRATDHASAAG